jgi:hypothetical protein
MSTIKGPEDIGFSKTSFLVGSMGVFAAGSLFGVYRVFKKEKTTLNIKAQRPHVMLALRALGWGTALCFGTFAAAGATFTYVTKVTTLQEFDTWARKVGLSVPIPQIIETQESKAEAKELEDDMNNFVESVVNGSLLSGKKEEDESEEASKK